MSYWFRPKYYGYGATPNTWQGWLLTLGYVAVLFAILQLLTSGGASRLAVLAVTVILTALFIWIVLKKTEGPLRWRWGSSGDGK